MIIWTKFVYEGKIIISVIVYFNIDMMEEIYLDYNDSFSFVKKENFLKESNYFFYNWVIKIV